MRDHFLYLLSLISFPVFAGVIGSGGTPPAMQDLLNHLADAAPGNGGLFIDKDKIGLGVNTDLNPGLVVSKIDLAPQSVRLPDIDFSTLAQRKGNIEALNLEGLAKSYKVEDGDSLDTLVLKDRRELARESVTPSISN